MPRLISPRGEPRRVGLAAGAKKGENMTAMKSVSVLLAGLTLAVTVVSLAPTASAICWIPGEPLYGYVCVGDFENCRIGVVGHDQIDCSEVNDDREATVDYALDEAILVAGFAEDEAAKTIQFVEDTWLS